MTAFSDFDPANYPDLFEIADNRIVYRRALRTGLPKSQVWSDPEERLRAWYYTKLVEDYGYPVERVDLEVEVFRRTPVDYADLVVYQDDALSRPFIVVECKAPLSTDPVFDQAMKQAWGNANNLRSDFAIAVDGAKEICFDPEGFDHKNPFTRLANVPHRYGEPIVFAKVKSGGSDDLLPATQDELGSRFRQCHDILWEGGKRNPAEAFDEMTKLMFSKLQDERIGTPSGDPYAFQVGSGEAPSEVAGRVKRIWSSYQNLAQPVFQSSILVSDDLIYGVVSLLQNTSLSKSDLDSKGHAFETFLPTVFRGDMGQYFTPRPIVRFMVDLVKPTISDKVIDPACGSGGFLLYALERMQQEAASRFQDRLEQRDYWVEWAQRSLFGVEVNDQISRVAMMGMILHEDGRTNIACHDALLPFGSPVTAPFFKEDTFHVILTNPPFGSSVKRVTKGAPHASLDAFELGAGRSSQKTEVLFLERCMQLLAPGGRMAVVLPEGILNNDNSARVRNIVETRGYVDAVISLPVETFMFSKAYVKSSVVLIRKFTGKEQEKITSKGAATLDYDVFIAHVDEVGITATGEIAPDRLGEVADAYWAYRAANPLDLRVRS